MYAHWTPTCELVEVYPGFLVAKDGGVFRRTHEGLAPRGVFYVDGYPTVSLLVGGRWQSRAVHQLVMRAFGPPRPSSRHVVRHKDGGTNPHIDNLVWGTRGGKKDDGAVRGGARAKPHFAQVYLSPEQLARVKSAAKQEGLSVSTFIRNCVLSHITGVWPGERS